VSAKCRHDLAGEEGVVLFSFSISIYHHFPHKIFRNKSFFYLNRKCSNKGGMGGIVFKARERIHRFSQLSEELETKTCLDNETLEFETEEG